MKRVSRLSMTKRLKFKCITIISLLIAIIVFHPLSPLGSTRNISKTTYEMNETIVVRYSHLFANSTNWIGDNQSPTDTGIDTDIDTEIDTDTDTDTNTNTVTETDAVTDTDTETSQADSLIPPADGAFFTAGASISMTFYVSGPDGIDAVRFWPNNGIVTHVMYTDTIEPYEYTLSGLTADTYILLGRSTDNIGTKLDSEKVTIMVEGSSSGGIDSWDHYELNILSYTRTGNAQNIILSGSKVETSEFLILTTSHGNAGDVIEKEARTIGGDWDKIIYAGNDDKSVEIWFRDVTSANEESFREIDSNNRAARLAILVYDRILNIGNIIEDKFLSNHPIAIDSIDESPFLIVATSNNGGCSDIADAEYGTEYYCDPLLRERTFNNEETRNIYFIYDAFINNYFI